MVIDYAQTLLNPELSEKEVQYFFDYLTERRTILTL